MTYLLDTHVWLWLLTTPERVNEELRQSLQLADKLWLSVASIWEIGIKYKLGKLPLPKPPGEFVPDHMAISGVTGLHIEAIHALGAADLPEHHKDPFDRMIIAQAQSERLSLVSADSAFHPYDVNLVRP